MICVSFLHVMSRFSKCWPFQQHSVGNGSLLWALSVPLWFCWVCQEYKTITVLNQGDFSGFYLSWGYEGWDNTSLREQEYFYSKAGNLPSSGVHLCITTLCTCKHPHLPSLPPGALGICSTGANLTAFAASGKLFVSPRSLLSGSVNL